jgi:HAMP domain-containing protein
VPIGSSIVFKLESSCDYHLFNWFENGSTDSESDHAPRSNWEHGIDWKQAFSTGGGVVHNARGFAHETIDSLTERMVRGRKDEVGGLESAIGTFMWQIKRAVNSAAIAERILAERDRSTGDGWLRVVQSPTVLRELCAETAGECAMRTRVDDASGTAEFIIGEEKLVRYIKNELDSVAAVRAFLRAQRGTYELPLVPILFANV